jgi:hypothetical protein
MGTMEYTKEKEKYHLLCDLLIFSRRMMGQNGPLSDWAEIYYGLEAKVEASSFKLRGL